MSFFYFRSRPCFSDVPTKNSNTRTFSHCNPGFHDPPVYYEIPAMRHTYENSEIVLGRTDNQQLDFGNGLTGPTSAEAEL